MKVDTKSFDDEDHSEAAIGEGVVVAIAVCTPFWLGIAVLAGGVSSRTAAFTRSLLFVVVAGASLAWRFRQAPRGH